LFAIEEELVLLHVPTGGPQGSRLRPSLDDPGAPDQTYAIFYGTVLHDGGKFRMWYYSSGKQRSEGPITYAESKDGVNWIKPDLGQVLINGSRQNNAIDLPDDRTQRVYIVKDDEEPARIAATRWCTRILRQRCSACR